MRKKRIGPKCVAWMKPLDFRAPVLAKLEPHTSGVVHPTVVVIVQIDVPVGVMRDGGDAAFADTT